MKYKYPEIDLISLARKWGNEDWAFFLKKCVRNNDLEKIRSTLYGIQRGMDTLVKLKLNSQNMCELFALWTRQLEFSAKEIFKRRYPCAFDNPSAVISALSRSSAEEEFKNKKKRDLAFQRFLKESRF